MSETIRIPIDCDADIIVARQSGRQMATPLGFSAVDLTMIATAISELARNIIMYAQRGVIELQIQQSNGREGIVVCARDEGPGIADIEQAQRIGYSSSGQLGLGLPGVRRLMDEMKIESRPGKGTVVTARKWRS